MHIGLTFDLKTCVVNGNGRADDAEEEFDSPHTIDAIADILRGLGHEVTLLGDGRECLQKLLEIPLDFVFNYAEGHGTSRSREARIPAALEMLGIPYTGSDPLTLAVTLDKEVAKRLVASAGVRVPSGFVVDQELTIDNYQLAIANCRLPAMVKPAWEGSSKGIRNKCLVRTADDLKEVVEELQRTQKQPILVEEFIEGDELTVGIFGNEAPEILGIMRISPREASSEFVYSLEVKRDYKRQVRYECPPPLEPAILQRVKDAALTAYRALGCRDVARIDFRMRAGVPYFLEVNPLPGLNPEDSDLIIMARLVGWNHGQVVTKILESAVTRCAAAKSIGHRAARMARSTE